MPFAPVVFVDTETTSLHPDTGQIYEVALVEMSGHEHHWWLPVSLEHADPFALQIGRFHDRHPNGYRYRTPAAGQPRSPRTRHYGMPTPRLFAAQFARLTHGKHVVGAVPSFDTTRLGRLLFEQGEMWEPWHYHLIDIETLIAGYLTGLRRAADEEGTSWGGLAPDRRPGPPWDYHDLIAQVAPELIVGLDDAARPVFRPEFEAHTALGDARLVHALYEKIMGLD